MCRLLYLFMKAFYTVIWYYFIPFSILYLSFFIPYVYGEYPNRYSSLIDDVEGELPAAAAAVLTSL